MEYLDTLIAKYDSYIVLLINGSTNMAEDAKRSKEQGLEALRQQQLQSIRESAVQISVYTEMTSDLKRLRSKLSSSQSDPDPISAIVRELLAVTERVNRELDQIIEKAHPAESGR